MKKNDFHPQDLRKAINEKRCIFACLDRIEFHVNKGDWEAARQAMNNLERSMTEIEHLQERKVDHDRHAHMNFLMSRSPVPLQSLNRNIN